MLAKNQGKSAQIPDTFTGTASPGKYAGNPHDSKAFQQNFRKESNSL